MTEEAKCARIEDFNIGFDSEKSFVVVKMTKNLPHV